MRNTPSIAYYHLLECSLVYVLRPEYQNYSLRSRFFHTAFQRSSKDLSNFRIRIFSTVTDHDTDFYRATHTHSAVYATGECLSVRLSQAGVLSKWLVDWVKVSRPTRHKIGHFGDVPKPISWLGIGKKQNLTQQKHAFINQNKCTTTQNKHKKTNPGLVASYDIRPGNGQGLFLFRRFIKLICHLLTYLDIYPLTYRHGTHTGLSKRLNRSSRFAAQRLPSACHTLSCTGVRISLKITARSSGTLFQNLNSADFFCFFATARRPLQVSFDVARSSRLCLQHVGRTRSVARFVCYSWNLFTTELHLVD